MWTDGGELLNEWTWSVTSIDQVAGNSNTMAYACGWASQASETIVSRRGPPAQTCLWRSASGDADGLSSTRGAWPQPIWATSACGYARWTIWCSTLAMAEAGT